MKFTRVFVNRNLRSNNKNSDSKNQDNNFHRYRTKCPDNSQRAVTCNFQVPKAQRPDQPPGYLSRLLDASLDQKLP